MSSFVCLLFPLDRPTSGVLGRQDGVVERCRLWSSLPSSPSSVDEAPQPNIVTVVVLEEEE